MQRPFLRPAAAILVGLFCAGLAGCATVTPYQPLAAAASRGEGGYADLELAPGRWQVRFAGNSLTSRETVEAYLLYRAAELTLEQHGTWFEIVRHDLEHEVRDVAVDSGYDRWWGYPGWQPYWHYYGRPYGWRYWYPGGSPFFETERIERFEARAEIVIHTDARPAGRSDAFDAAEVLARLGPSIGRPK